MKRIREKKYKRGRFDGKKVIGDWQEKVDGGRRKER